MKFAISYATPAQGVDADRLSAFARHAEKCGFEGLTVPDHVALYPGASIGGYGELPTDLALSGSTRLPHVRRRSHTASPAGHSSVTAALSAPGIAG
jgi:alkanesulfonate monooxygenase SsuD/methylene tetrahydromethanopterin reductase-like flavin-dependent oxidoreductase (luciferase family)